MFTCCIIHGECIFWCVIYKWACNDELFTEAVHFLQLHVECGLSEAQKQETAVSSGTV